MVVALLSFLCYNALQMELQLAKKNKTVVVPTADDTSATVTGTVEATGVVADTDAVTTDTTAVPTDTTTATTGQLNIDQALNSLNMGNPTWDLFLVGFFVVGALLYGLSLGKDRIIAIMVSIYMALAVVAALPEFVLNIKVNDSYTVQITAFLSVFIVLFFLLSRQAVLNALAPSGEGKWWQTLVFSVLHVGLLVSVTLSFMPASILGKFSSLTQYIFTNEWTNFGWIAAPIVAMILIGRNRE